MELEKEDTLEVNKLIEIYNELENINNEIQQNIQSNEQATFFNRILTNAYKLKLGNKELVFLLISINYISLLSFAIFNHNSLQIFLIGPLLYWIIFAYLFLIGKMVISGNTKSSKKGIISYLKNMYYYALNIKNEHLFNKKIALQEILEYFLNTKVIKEIYSFYEKQPYQTGTNENLILVNNFQKIKTAVNEKNYNQLIETYREDSKKYSYSLYI